jgi:hypothetical protein
MGWFSMAACLFFVSRQSVPISDEKESNKKWALRENLVKASFCGDFEML